MSASDNGKDIAYQWVYGVTPWGECIFQLASGDGMLGGKGWLVRYVVQIRRAGDGRPMLLYLTNPDFVLAGNPVHVTFDKIIAAAPASEEAVEQVCKMCGLTRIHKPTAAEAKKALDDAPRLKLV